ncbi:HNH endonuclease domain-containing protein [Kiritimatiellota bacterium B12222]|nr:HNH endonuclease domain-containing protein [Kiritimatiellota bacterium B12222]
MKWDNQWDRKQALDKWSNHPFYTSAIVLGIDIGLGGIGLYLRKGDECLFRRTLQYDVPKSAPLETRRAFRAARHARQSARKRERYLKEWIVKYGLLSHDEIQNIWKNPKVFERAFLHRLRGLEPNGLSSPHALVVCIRHILGLRGYDYHLYFENALESSFPWGSDWNLSDIRKWARNGTLEAEYGLALKQMVQNGLAEESLKTNDENEVCDLINQAIERGKGDPIREMLEKHFSQNKQNLREPARGYNFSREQVKSHLRQLCENHQSFFPDGKFDQAMLELIGEQDIHGKEIYNTKDESIIDYHRKTADDAKKLWERKVKNCTVANFLINNDLIPKNTKIKCAKNDDLDVRLWKLLSFLIERRVDFTDGTREPLNEAAIGALLEFVREDTAAWRAKTKRPKKPTIKSVLKEHQGLIHTTKKSELNAAFDAQIADLLKPKASVLNQRANICTASAKALFNMATDDGSHLDAKQAKKNLHDYYRYRKNNSSVLGLYPQVEYLLGAPGQYDENQNSKDTTNRKDGQPQEHGILRRLFADQLVLDTKEHIRIKHLLDGKTCPDYVIIESVGDQPRNTEQRKKIEKEQKDRKEAKKKIVSNYGYDIEKITPNEVQRIMLFDQQTNPDGKTICPYTGQDLGTDPLAQDLEVEHIFPASRGGISIMENLALTWKNVNQDKGNQTPHEFLGDQTTRYISGMKWNKRKKDIFFHKTSDVPDWENMTRTAQLARNLKAQVINWLQITNNDLDDTALANEIRRRICCPSGGMTAACREAWEDHMPADFFYVKNINGKDRKIKNRGNLRHHMWDAAVVSYIPPGNGLNSIYHGGIFESHQTQKGVPKMKPLPELAPPLDKIHANGAKTCYVSKLRSKSSKKSRTDTTILSPPDPNGKMLTRFKNEVSKTCKDGLVKSFNPGKTEDQFIQNIRNVGITEERLPDKVIRNWLNTPDNKPLKQLDGTPVKKLQLPAGKSPNEVSRFPHYKTIPDFQPGNPSFGKEKSHTLIGFKAAGEVNECLEIYEYKNKKGEVDYKSRVLPTPRNLEVYRRTHGESYKITPPPPHSKRVAVIRNGDLLLADFDYNGKFVQESQYKYCSLWMRVKAIKTKGELEFIFAEYSDISSLPFKSISRKNMLWSTSSATNLFQLSRIKKTT